MVSTARIEADGYADTIVGIAEKCYLCGRAWRMSTGPTSLTAGQYQTISFTTPATGTTLYQLSTIDKTGDELEITLVEGGTYNGGTEIPLWNFNRIIGDTNPPFIAKKGGTIAGGLNAPIKFMGGTGVGANKPGGMSEAPSNIVLKSGTLYTLKITSIGSAKVSALLTVIYRLG